ncbi:MAG: T9SS type A sorting domain-containing protein [Saprospiraceae bacterium]
MTKHSLFILVNLCLLLTSLHAQPVRLVKDITPGTGSTFSSDFTPTDDGIISAFGNSILFIVKDADQHFNLWVSDGEEDGTYPLHGLSDGEKFNGFINADDDHFYYVVETDAGSFLYSLSKSTLDTIQVYANPEEINYLTYLNGQLYFEVEDALITVDPNSQVSKLVYQFGSFRSIRDIGVLNDGLILIGGESNGTELYSSDGTTAGTKAFYQLNSGSEFSGDYYMTEVDGQLFFFYNKPSEPYVLYVTDGTKAGTKPLIELERITFINLEKGRSIIGWEGRLFFRGRALGNGSNQDELFVSDGTVAGTFKIDINNEWSKPAFFTPYNGELYFMADEYGYVFNVFKTDGTQAGTVRAIDPWDLGSGNSFGGNFMVEHNDSLYFYADRSAVGQELWVSGVSTSSTSCIDIVPGSGSSVPTQMTSTDNYLFLIYHSEEFGKELFVLDPPTSGTQDVLSEGIRLYPNPFTDHVMIDLASKNDNWFLEILDLDGKTVFGQAVQEGKVDLPDVPAGMYFAVLQKDGFVFARRLMKL